MYLSPYGQIAHNLWEWIIDRYPYLKSHAFVVMPNHVHAVVEIDSEWGDTDSMGMG